MNETDPRVDFRLAMAWAITVARQVRPDQYPLATSCAEWDVRGVLNHLTGAAAFVTTAFGGQVTIMEGADPIQEFETVIESVLKAIEDDAVLTAIVDWYPDKVSGTMLISIFTSEFLVHGWDLATATGQDCEAPAELAERVLAVAQVGVPAEGRNSQIFGPVVPVSDDAGPTRKLAAWLGRGPVAL